LLRRKIKDPNIAASEGHQQEEENRIDKSAVSEQSSFENANEELLRSLQELKSENETLRLEIKSGKKVIESLTGDLRKNSRL
jgi:hypothetical protein